MPPYCADSITWDLNSYDSLAVLSSYSRYSQMDVLLRLESLPERDNRATYDVRLVGFGGTVARFFVHQSRAFDGMAARYLYFSSSS